jgi:hypothetical protein
MKTSFFFLILLTFPSAHASKFYQSCNNSLGNIAYSTSQDDEENKTKVVITGYTMMGEVKKEFQGTELVIEKKTLATFKEEATDLQTFCDKTYPLVVKEYAIEIKIQKKDGTEFIEGDTPPTEADKVLVEYMICSEKTVGSWPCP